MSLNGCRYNSAPAMREALQHFWCAAAARSKFVSGNSQEVRSHPLLIVGISMPDGDGSVWRSSPAMSFASKNGVQAAEQDLQGDDG